MTCVNCQLTVVLAKFCSCVWQFIRLHAIAYRRLVIICFLIFLFVYEQRQSQNQNNRQSLRMQLSLASVLTLMRLPILFCLLNVCSVSVIHQQVLCHSSLNLSGNYLGLLDCCSVWNKSPLRIKVNHAEKVILHEIFF